MRRYVYWPSFVFLLIIVLLTLPHLNDPAVKALNPGDYVLFGNYMGDPVLWRVIDTDSSKDPLLFSEYIISLKAYDAKGDSHSGSLRKKYGSNYWPESNLRQWLNSADKKIDWLSDPPSEKNLCGGSNAYQDECGFLSNGNFTAAERRAIKPVSHNIPLGDADKDKKTGGGEPYLYDRNIQVYKDYDKAYYQTVSDKVFLLSKKELEKDVYDRGWEFRTSVTEKALHQGSYETYRTWMNQFGEYWVIDPGGNYSSNVVVVLGDKDIVHAMAYSVEGVRPALYVSLSGLACAKGSGSKDDPYVLKGRGF